MDASLAILLAASLLLAGAAGIPRLRPGWPVWLRMVVRVAAFVGLTVLVRWSTGSPLAPQWDGADVDRQVWQQVLVAGWWILAGRVAVGLVRLFVVLKNRPRETRILADLLAGAVYVATALSVVAFAFSVPLGGLLATSGVIAIVLGLALQSTLSDVFSGIAVGLEKPYAAGDHVWIEGGIEGQILEVNWRSARIATPDRNIATIPNSVIAKARLINHSVPTLHRRDSIEVSLDAHADPARCAAVLTAAVRNCGTVLDDPPPSIFCTGLAGDGLGYRIGFSVKGSLELLRTRSELFIQMHRHLRHAGIALAVPGKARPRPVPVPSLLDLLTGSELFSVVDGENRAVLARFFKPAQLDEGEVLLRPGEVPDALVVVASGTIGVSMPGPNGPRPISRLGPGETLGAAGLVTGRPSAATATALSPLQVYRLERDDLGAGIAGNAELSASLQVLAERVVACMRQNALRDEAEASHAPAPADAFRSFLRMLNLKEVDAGRPQEKAK